MPDVARCVAGALIRNGRVLLVKRSSHKRHYPGVWDLLMGGHLEGDESREDALRREALEELQVEIESFHPLGTIHDPVEPAEVSVYVVSRWSGEPVNAAPDEHSEIRWFSTDELPRSVALEGYDRIERALARAMRESARRSRPQI